MQSISLLESVAAETLQRISRLAAAAFRAPVAQINLVRADRQISLCSVGPEPFEGRLQVPIDFSYCRYVVASGKPVAIADARLHPLVRDSPSTTQLGIVAYASVPIGRGGDVLGTLCVGDFRPRDWEPEIGLLKEIAGFLLAEVERSIQAETRRQATEEARSESEARYRQLVELSPDAIAIHRAGRLAFINQAGARLLGAASPEELADAPILDLIHPDSHDEVRRRLQRISETGAPAPPWQVRFLRRDGSVIHGEVVASPFFTDQGEPAVQMVVRDLTERHAAEKALREKEEQLRQAQKMEAVGQLAGGIAHDFNNLLGVISGNADLALLDLPDAHPLRHELSEIRTAAHRAAALTHQLLAFSRKQVAQPEVLDLNRVIEDMGRMLRRIIGEHIELVLALDPGVGRVRADPGQMDQILLNLAVNARDAMPEGGTLVVATREVRLDAEQLPAPDAGMGPGAYVRLTVRDDGAGIPEELRRRIFEPFFTTKDPGRGTGLGLSTVYGIARQNGGFVTVESEVGRGTTFHVFLPLVEAGAEPRAAPAERVPPAAGQTVLVVEDEDAMRALVRRVLQDAGYTVLEAANGRAALETAELYAGRIHLLLVDVVMPGMSGREAADRLCRIRPDLRVLYMSGYTDDAVVRHGVLEPGVDLLQKPFSPEQLTTRVRQVLRHPE